MDMYPKYTSPFGYQTGVGGIDTYGVNHNNFSLRDEIEYQFARQKRENQLMQQYNNQGITENYPQYTTNFWGNSANNYGFGMTNIAGNIENMQTTNQPQIQPRIWETSTDGKQIYDDFVKIEGDYKPQDQNILEYSSSAIRAIPSMVNNYVNLRNANLTDKYKHAMMNCNAAQYGQGGADIARMASNAKEFYDTTTGANTLDSSQGDQYANKIGRLLGSKYPNGDCNELVQRYIQKHW